MRSRLEFRRTPEDDGTVIGVRLQDGTHAAITIFDSDDDGTASGKFAALAQRIDPAPQPPRAYHAPRRRRR